MRRLFAWLHAQVMYLLAPPHCSYCKVFLNERAILCATCMAQIQPIATKDLAITVQYSVPVIAIADYQEPLKTLIKAKHHGDLCAAHELAELIWHKTTLKHIPCDYIIPIPLHWTRYAWRGFNQAAEIANVLSKHKKVPAVHLVRRVRKTTLQAMLPKDERAANLKQAFALATGDLSRYQGKHLVLVDDLMTTGVTIQEAVRCVRLVNPASITVVVACRVV